MLLDRYVGFHHVASADQLFPHHHPRYASPMSLWLMVYRHSPYDHLSALAGAMFSSTRLRARHLSHDAQSVFAFSPCSQFRCKGVPSTTLARNLRRRSDLRAWSRDQMHSPPTDSRKSVVLWVFVIPFYSETPTLRRCIPLVNQCQTLELLIALGIDSDSSASLPSDLTEFTARHTTGEDRIWIDCRFSHIRTAVLRLKNQPLSDASLSVRYHANLTSVSSFVQAPITPSANRNRCGLCKSQNKHSVQSIQVEIA